MATCTNATGTLQTEAAPPASALACAPCLPALATKVAIVTGASAGIGRACVAALMQLQMRVVACARRKEKLEGLKAELTASGLPADDLLLATCDVQQEADIRAVMAQAEERWGCAPSVVINSAGLSLHDTTMLEGSTASWAQMMNTNVIAVAVVTREAVAAMRRHGTGGHIVNISSMSAYRIPAFSGGAFYAATKHALRCISDGTRLEAQQQGLDLRVTCLSPGVVETEFYDVRHKGDPDGGKGLGFEPLDTSHVTQALLYALGAPPGVNVDDVIVRSMSQPL